MKIQTLHRLSKGTLSRGFSEAINTVEIGDTTKVNVLTNISAKPDRYSKRLQSTNQSPIVGAAREDRKSRDNALLRKNYT
jgi:hypothetical protein